MINLVLAIFMTTTLFVLFKEFKKNKINTSQAITFNYLSAFLISIISINMDISIITNEWFFHAILLGSFFVIMFNIMAKSTQLLGISVSSMASKMSLIIPVIGAIIIHHTSVSIHKTCGLIIAIISIYLTFKKDNIQKKSILAFLLFIGAGILDMWIDLIRILYIDNNSDFNQFISTIFISAFITGLVKNYIKKESINKKDISAGIILGLPNYLSIYFVLLALESLGTIYVFSILNIGVVVLSTLISYFLYKEQLSNTNIIGVLLACISILIIANS